MMAHLPDDRRFLVRTLPSMGLRTALSSTIVVTPRAVGGTDSGGRYVHAQHANVAARSGDPSTPSPTAGPSDRATHRALGSGPHRIDHLRLVCMTQPADGECVEEIAVRDHDVGRRRVQQLHPRRGAAGR
jgi:hypothetical protein